MISGSYDFAKTPWRKDQYEAGKSSGAEQHMKGTAWRTVWADEIVVKWAAKHRHKALLYHTLESFTFERSEVWPSVVEIGDLSILEKFIRAEGTPTAISWIAEYFVPPKYRLMSRLRAPVNVPSSYWLDHFVKLSNHPLIIQTLFTAYTLQKATAQRFHLMDLDPVTVRKALHDEELCERILLKHTNDLESQSNEDRCISLDHDLLCSAVLANDTSHAKKYLETSKADVNGPVGDIADTNLLSMAVQNGDTAMVSLLLSHGSNPNSKDASKGRNPLHQAVVLLRTDILNHL